MSAPSISSSISSSSIPTSPPHRHRRQQHQHPPVMMMRLPRMVLTLLMVFVTCFVYYIEFLWQHQQSIQDAHSFFHKGDKYPHYQYFKPNNNRGAPGQPLRTSRRRQQVGMDPTSSGGAGTPNGSVGASAASASSTTARGRVDPSSSSSLRQQPAGNEPKPQEGEQSREGGDGPEPPRSRDEEEEKQHGSEPVEEESEEERLKRGIQLMPNELDEFTMERKRQSQNFDKYSLPPIDTILSGNRDDDEANQTVIGSPQPVLDFAIIGFGKCGTTSAMHLLRSHSQLQSLQSEMWALFAGDIPKLVNRMYEKLTLALPRGYKCPGDIFSPNSLNLFRDHFPKTKLIIGIRHPVPWFQSLYNFRVQNFDSYEQIPAPINMIGICTREMLMSCTQRGNFGHFLMKLGKQQFLWNDKNHPEYDATLEVGDGNPAPYRVVPDTLEYNLSHWYDKYGDKRWAYEKWDATMFAKPVPNPVFLFELNQLSNDNNSTRAQQFRHDLASFLEVSPDGFHPQPERVSPGKIWDEETQRKKDARKINICDDQHQLVRQELMATSRATSLWIRTVFLKSPGVYSSSTNDHLEELFEKWMHDPCDEVKTKPKSDTDTATSR